MKHSTTSTFSATVLALVLLGLGGCAGMTARERSTATGAVIGGAVGVITGGGALGRGLGRRGRQRRS